VLWVNTHLPAQRISQPAPARPAASTTRTRTQSSAGSRTRPANAGTRSPGGLTRPPQDSSRQSGNCRTPKFSKTYLVVRHKLQAFPPPKIAQQEVTIIFPFPKMSAGCDL